MTDQEGEVELLQNALRHDCWVAGFCCCAVRVWCRARLCPISRSGVFGIVCANTSLDCLERGRNMTLLLADWEEIVHDVLDEDSLVLLRVELQGYKKDR